MAPADTTPVLTFRDVGGGYVRISDLGLTNDALVRIDTPGGGYALPSPEDAVILAELLLRLAADRARKAGSTVETYKNRRGYP